MFFCISLTGVDSVGTVPNSLLTYAAGAALQPDLIINAGTAGGFQVLHYFLWFERGFIYRSLNQVRSIFLY